MTERGSLLVSVVFLTAVAGLTAAALDITSWYRTNRKLQAHTDAAVLAGAQALPDNPRAARTLAGEGEVRFSTAVLPNDTITVRRKLPASGVFGRVRGTTEVEAEATARVGLPSKTRWASPVAVDERHPELSHSGCPCWKQTTHVRVELLDLGRTGTPATWIRDGFSDYMSRGWYARTTSAAASSPRVHSALKQRVGSELLLPVYREKRKQNGTFHYRVVGWTGFHVTGFDAAKRRLHGWFERVIWDGIPSQSGSQNDFGVRTIALIG
jgi:putative Flp pilus-assembly TadE/G-like protein